MQIAFTEVDAEDVASIQKKFPGSIILEHPLQEEDISECSDVEILCCFIYSKLSKDRLDQLPSLRLICTRSVGFDHIDMNECTKRGITVCNVPDYGSHVIAEHVFALLLAASRHIGEADKRTEQGQFDYHGLRGMALNGKTIGVIGTGKIGRAVCKIAHGFGMKILAFDQCRTLDLEQELGVSYVPLEELLSESDVMTLHLPATEETTHMINVKTIATMKDGVTLINTARGALIDTKALVDGIKKGKFAHVLLDVLEHEQNFEQNKELIGLPEVITTPHIAFFADDSMHNMYKDAFESIDAFLAGTTPEHTIQPPNVICDLPGLQTGKQ